MHCEVEFSLTTVCTQQTKHIQITTSAGSILALSGSIRIVLFPGRQKSEEEADKKSLKSHTYMEFVVDARIHVVAVTA
jgi:hypothetical protein